MPAVEIPEELAGLPVVAACPPSEYLPLSNNDGMHGPGRDEFRRFESLVVCVDEESGGVFVFMCIGDWQTLADDWYETVEDALRSIEQQYPGIGAVLVRR